jgi:hypothetical protein
MRRYGTLLLLGCLSVFASGARSERRVSNESQSAGRVQDSSGRQGRLMPPATLSCDVNNTTSFTGRVLAYARSRKRIFLRLRTDEATTEQFTIGLSRNEAASGKYLFRGESFKPEDWKKVELASNRLRQGMRATVWACYVNGEPKAELVDWRPPEGRTNSVY